MRQADDLAHVRSQLALLEERCARLSEHLGQAAQELAAGGALPEVALVDELDAVRAQFADVRRATFELAAAVLEGPTGAEPRPLREVASLAGLRELAHTTGEAIDRQAALHARQQALAVLERVQRLRHRDEPRFPPLEVAQALARQLQDAIADVQWPASHPELEALAEGRHPLAYLLEFAERAADLDDSRWEFLHDALTEAFGRPLAVAVARSKVLAVDQAPEDAERDEDDWPTFTMPRPRWPPADPSPAAPASGATPAERPAEPVATSALEEQAEPDLGGSTDELIWQALLRQDAGAAFLVARYQAGEGDAGQPPCVPAWLLRALALSPYVLYANGDLALELARDLACWTGPSVEAEAESEDVGRAVRLLLAAAALRPALVAPDTGAWSILRALPTDSALPSFSRCAQVVADYGERHPPLMPWTFAAPLAPAIWRDALEDLLREIGAWRVRFLGMRSTFPPATDVWQRWLRPDGLVHALLAPLTVDHHGLEAARGLVERLSNEDQIRWEIGDTDRRLLGRARGPDIVAHPAAAGQLVARVHEAVAFARRWIAFQENRPGRPDDEPRRLARRLAEQLSELREAVARELAGEVIASAPLPVRAAVAQCRAALARVDALLGVGASDGQPWAPIDEPPPGLVLYADLLRVPVPDLELDADWHPRGIEQIDPAALTRGLRGVIAAGQPPDWYAVFTAHLRRHDHLATAQVLECLEVLQAAGGAPSDTAELRAARADDLDRCRARLRREVELVRARVDAAAADGRLGDEQRVRLLASLEHIALAGTRLLRFEPAFARLRRVSDEVDRLPLPDTQPPWATDARTADADAGRAAERAALVAPDGPCLLVGLPTLDGATLLRATADSFQAAADGHVALLLDLAPDVDVAPEPAALLASADDVPPSDRLWRALAAALGAAGILPSASHSASVASSDDLLQDVGSWVAARPDRRLLVLLDQADGLVEEEAHGWLDKPLPPDEAALFPTARRLAEVIDASAGRIKVVLAGSLAVLRAARLRQYPLARRGYVRLRPLLDEGDARVAIARLRRALDGLEPESPAVTARALSLANYEPGTISHLGACLARRVTGPILTAASLEEWTASREGARALTDGLRAALGADPRYAIVVYSLALAHWSPPDHAAGDDAADDAVGVTGDWLREQASLWWEPGFRYTWSEDDFGNLLDEMVALGLLRAVAADRFVLGSPARVPLLGTEDELMARLFEYGRGPDEAAVEDPFPPAGFRPAVATGPAGRGPLTAQQLSHVLGPGPLATLVFGTEAAGLWRIIPSLPALAGATRVFNLTPPPDAADCAALMRLIHGPIAGAASTGGSAHLRLLVPPTWAWDQAWVDRVLDRLAGTSASIRVIFLADPAATWRLLEPSAGNGAAPLAWLRARGVALLSLGPWRESLVRQWCASVLPEEETNAGPARLEDATGGWPLLLEQSRPEPGQPLTAGVDPLAANLAAGSDGPVASTFGLDLVPGRILHALASLEHAADAALRDLGVQLEDDATQPLLRRSLEWARLLQLARPLGGGRWRLDPLVARVLGRDPPEEPFSLPAPAP